MDDVSWTEAELGQDRIQTKPARRREPEKKTTEDTNMSFKGLSVKSKKLYPSCLPYGSLAPRTRSKRSWKEKYISQREENKLLREENEQLKEKMQEHEDEQSRLQEISREHAARLVSIDSSGNVQIGNHNLQVVHNNFDAASLKELLDQYEDKIKEDARQRQKMKGQIQDLSSKIEELTTTRRKSGQIVDCSGGTDYLAELHKLSDQEKACPDCAITKMSEQITDLAKNFSAFCSSQKTLSTVSLDERQSTRLGNCKCKCQKMIHSEPNINVHC